MLFVIRQKVCGVHVVMTMARAPVLLSECMVVTLGLLCARKACVGGLFVTRGVGRDHQRRWEREARGDARSGWGSEALWDVTYRKFLIGRGMAGGTE